MPLAVVLLFAASAAAVTEADAAPSASPASDSSASFTWSAPPPCPTRAEVLARAEQLVGHPLKRAPGTEELVLVGEVQLLSSAKWELRATSGTKRESERTVSADSCEELAEAMALFIALSIDPDYAARGSSSPLAPSRATFADVPSSSASGPPPATLPPTAASSPPLPPPPKREPELSSSPRDSGLPVRSGPPVGLAVGALGAMWVGRLPGAAPGVVLHGALSLKPWVTAVELGYFPAQHVVNGSAAGDISLATLSGSIGYALFDGLLTPFVGVELERMHGVGAVSQPESGNIWLLAVDAGLRFSYPVQPALRLVLAGHVSALPGSARFHIEPDTELFRPARVGAQLGLGAEFRLR